jgi:hypothetical protein
MFFIVEVKQQKANVNFLKFSEKEKFLNEAYFGQFNT